MNLSNDARYTRQARRTVRVKLACGCALLLRDSPSRNTTLFACTTGQAHGYQLPWVEWTDTATGRVGWNESLAKG